MLSIVITVKHLSDDQVKVTFALPDDGNPVAVVGCFNDWDRGAHPLKRRSNGMRSAAVSVPAGSRLRFRYVTTTPDGDRWFDDADAAWQEPNGFGETHSVLAV